MEHCSLGMMVAVTLQEARAKHGDNLRVAALGAVGPPGDERVIHDATHHVGVNSGIRVRDQDETPLHSDVLAALEAEVKGDNLPMFGLAFDISKAHRRVPVDPRDWGLQACSLVPPQQAPSDGDRVYLNTVGTYGFGSASYHWNRLGALILRVLLYIGDGHGLRWLFRFADDFLALVRSSAVWRPLMLIVLLMRALRIPLKWSKCRGGTQLDWIGFYLDLEGQQMGMSDKRCAWAARWCKETAESGTVVVRHFREALGRLSFSAGPLLFVRPFLGPLYAWCSVVADEKKAPIPPMVIFVLKWIAEQFERKERVHYGAPISHVGERYRADAKAEGDKIVLGGWELLGSADPKLARWYSVRLGRAEIPWAYTRGDPFRSIAALELLATLLCVAVFQPEASSLTGGTIALTAAGDNQSNGFTLDRLCSNKFPLCLVLMELSEQLRRRQILLNVSWRPRDENEEADALTNENFSAFSLDRRVAVEWADLDLMVLPRLTAMADEHFHMLSLAKRESRKRPLRPASPAQPRGQRLRDRDPW